MKSGKFQRIFLISLLLLLTTAFIFEGVNASTTTFGQEFINMLRGNMDTVGENVAAIIPKILLIALVVFLVYSIAGALPFIPEKDSIRWMISIIIGILSFIFVSAEDIRYILINYEALGIALTTFIPLIIIIIFTFEFHRNKPELAFIINKFIVLLFVFYILFQWWNVRISVEASAVMLAYPLTLIFALIWLVAERWVYFKVLKETSKGNISAARNLLVKKWEARITQIDSLLESAAPDTARVLDRERQELLNKIKNTRRR